VVPGSVKICHLCPGLSNQDSDDAERAQVIDVTLPFFHSYNGLNWLSESLAECIVGSGRQTGVDGSMGGNIF